jgi:hypothetical protein
LIGFGRRLRSGFAGFCRYNNKQIENQPNNKHQQITATKKLTITTTKKKKKKKKKKSANTPILDRTDEVEGGAVAKSARSGQNPARSHQI